MHKYFELVDLPVPCCFILQDGSRLDLRLGIPKNALPAFKNGFKNLGLKPGAEELFKKDKISDLISIIQIAKRVQDVEILALAKPDSPKVQEAAKARIAQIK